jgi:hypothetical protein
MTALRLPGGAPVRSNPPWNGQRPEEWPDSLVQGVASGRRAPQMRRLSSVSFSLTAASQSLVQERAQGVPRVVSVDMVLVPIGCSPSIYIGRGVAVGRRSLKFEMGNFELRIGEEAKGSLKGDGMMRRGAG